MSTGRDKRSSTIYTYCQIFQLRKIEAKYVYTMGIVEKQFNKTKKSLQTKKKEV